MKAQTYLLLLLLVSKDIKMTVKFIQIFYMLILNFCIYIAADE